MIQFYKKGYGTPLITIICLHYGSNWPISWQVLFWRNYPVELLILDGSERAADETCCNARLLGLGSLRYLHLPFTSYHYRLRVASKLVNTDFTIIIDHEEAYVFTGIVKAMDFLANNPDYSAACGVPFTIAADHHQIVISPWQNHTNWSAPLQLSENTASYRISKMLRLNRTANVYYSVHRASLLINYMSVDWESCLDNDWIAGGEIAWATYLANSGKILCESYPFWFRYVPARYPHEYKRHQPLAIEIEQIAASLELKDEIRFFEDIWQRYYGITPSIEGPIYKQCISSANSARAVCSNYVSQFNHATYVDVLHLLFIVKSIQAHRHPLLLQV